MEHVSRTGSRQFGGVLENGYTGMSPFTSPELPSAIPSMYVYVYHEVCAGTNTQCRNYRNWGSVRNDMQSFTSR